MISRGLSLARALSQNKQEVSSYPLSYPTNEPLPLERSWKRWSRGGEEEDDEKLYLRLEEEEEEGGEEEE
jgi:TATA-binding protein-associated factor Taf7